MNVIELEQVDFVRGGQKLIQEISWQVAKGEHWVLLGLNGSGKTTLLNLLAGNAFPTTGKVKVLGETFGQTNLVTLRKKIGWVTHQLTQEIPAHDTAERIVVSGKFASKGVWEEVSQDTWKKACELLIHLGGGRLITKKFHLLSQGEKQLVLLARSLMAQPQLLILDEAMNGLDLFARKQFEKVLEHVLKLPYAPSILFVTHHTEEIPDFIENICLLKDGKIFLKGKKKDILNKSTLTTFYEKEVQIFPLEDGHFFVKA